MTKPVTLSLDVMGGDRGPDMVLPGAEIALVRCPSIRFILFGDEARIAPLLAARPKLAAASEVRHCDIAVAHGRTSPARRCATAAGARACGASIEAVKTGEAAAAVSAGNTGALMAMAKFCLRTMARASSARRSRRSGRPSAANPIVLDVGATIGADAGQLADFAILGGAMARAVLGVERPTIGLLNVGVEEVKGLEEIKAAARILREQAPTTIAYHGFVEGDDVGSGTVDVVVTEGFAGNIALKTAEGTARQIGAYLKAAMNRSLMSRLGYLLAKRAFDQLREKMDPRTANGGVFLGLNGLVIKSHGGTDAEGFASAVELAFDMAKNDLQAKIADDIRGFRKGRCSSPRLPRRVRREHHAFGHPRQRQRLAGGRRHQRRPRQARRHLGRVDRPAHRHPRAAHRRPRRVSPRRSGSPPRAARSPPPA
jgi:glycerol-3-phosphate acyltransferase PlsX